LSDTIRQARKANGLTLRELADQLGVSAAAASQLERFETKGTIKLATLQRAHDALGSHLRITASPTPGVLRQEERVSWELHRTIAAKLLEDPKPILSRVPENVARIRANVRGAKPNQWLDDWERICATSLADTIHTLLDTSQYGIDMRRIGPFLGALTQNERLAAIARAGADA
jgi:transcriptional regulator with XRE-family HTH domain